MLPEVRRYNRFSAFLLLEYSVLFARVLRIACYSLEYCVLFARKKKHTKQFIAHSFAFYFLKFSLYSFLYRFLQYAAFAATTILRSFKPQELTIFLWSVAKCGAVRNNTLFRRALPVVLELWPRLKVGEVSQIQWTFSQEGMPRLPWTLQG